MSPAGQQGWGCLPMGTVRELPQWRGLAVEASSLVGSVTCSRSQGHTGQVSEVSKQLERAEGTVPTTGGLSICPFQEDGGFLFTPSWEAPASSHTIAVHWLVTPASRAISPQTGGDGSQPHSWRTEATRALPCWWWPGRFGGRSSGLRGSGFSSPGDGQVHSQEREVRGRAPRGKGVCTPPVLPPTRVVGPPKGTVPSPPL